MHIYLLFIIIVLIIKYSSYYLYIREDAQEPFNPSNNRHKKWYKIE